MANETAESLVDERLAQAANALASRDPVLARLVDKVGLPHFPPPTDNHFATLVRSITYQQLARNAAHAIHQRVVKALGGEVTPERVAAATETELRATGLSANKVNSIKDLAFKVLSGKVELEPEKLERLDDEEVIRQLTNVRGVGKWSAETFLIFQLGRLDVWPTGGLGIRRGYAAAWSVPVPSPKQLEPLGDPYRPYRSVLAWYCWSALQLAGRPGEERPERGRVQA